MRRVRTVGAVIGLILVGCNLPEVKVVEELPDPVVEQPRVTRREAPPAPRPPIVTPRVVGEPGWIPPGGISSRWTAIVVHHSDSERGNAASMDDYHRNVKGWDELGYHFVIGNGSLSGDGEIEVGPRWRKQKHGAHAKTPDNYYNEHGIGICLVGDFTNHGPSPAQMRSLEKLVRFLMHESSISPVAVLGHREVKPTECPGRRFPLLAFRNRMAAVSAMDERRLGSINSFSDSELHHALACDCGSPEPAHPTFGPTEITAGPSIADKSVAKPASGVRPGV